MAFDFDASGNLVSAPSGSGFDFDADGNLLAGTPKEPGGFAAAAKQAVGATIKGVGRAASDYIPGVDADNAVTRYGQEVVDANPTAVNSFADMADKPLTTVKEATGNAAGSMAGMVGARALGMGITAAAPLTGPAAPVVAGIGQVIAWLGPIAVASLPSYGSIRDKQILNDPAAEESAKAKAIAALGAGAVGAIETKFGPQEWALSAMTKEGRSQLAKKFAETGIVKGLTYGAAKGALIEGGEELVQNPIEQAASFDNPLTPANLKETAFGGAMGAVGGGVFGGATGAAFNLGNKAEVKPDPVKGILSAPDVDTAISVAQTALAQPLTGPLDLLQGQDPLLGAMREREANPPTFAPANDPEALLNRPAGDPLAPMLEDRRIRNDAQEQIAREEEARKQSELDAIPQQAAEQNTVQAALERAGTLETPTAMELALQRAKAAPAPAIEAAPVESAPALPRVVERTPEMVALPQKLAEQRAAANPSLEVVRIQNKSGKFAFTIIPKAADVSASVGDARAVPVGVDGRSADLAGGESAGGLTPEPAGRGISGSAGTAVDGGGATVSVANGSGESAPVATWFGRRGDGYLTEGDAMMAIPSRQRVQPELSWKVEQLPTGNFRLAGYEGAGVKSQDGANGKLPSGNQAAPIAGSRDAIAGRGLESTGPVVGEDGVRPVPAPEPQPERRPGLQGVGEGDTGEGAGSAGQPAAGAPPVPESAAQVTQTPPTSGVSTSAPEKAETISALPTERERIQAMRQRAAEKRAAQSTSPAELTPKEKKALEGNPLRLFLMRNGVSMNLARSFVPGTKERLAMGRTFRHNGLALDELAVRAAEQGFIKDASDTGALYDLIQRAVSGERVAPLVGQDGELDLRAAVERQRELEQDAESAVSDLAGEELAIQSEILDDVPDMDAPGNASVEDAMRALGFTEQEIRDATAQGTRQPQAARQGDGGAAETASGQAQGNRAGGNQEAPEVERFAVGRSLTKEQRRSVLETLVDVYKAKGAPKEFKGFDSDGNERYGYAYSPELFEKSSITGAMVRYLVTLPDGRVAHPTELFPDYTQSKIDAEVSRRAAEATSNRREVARMAAPAQQFDSIEEAARFWDDKSDESLARHGRWRTVLPSLERTSLTSGEKFIMVPDTTMKNGAMVEALADAGWKRPARNEEGLTRPTPADVLAQQDRAAQAERDQKAADKAAADKAKADAERDEFRLSGSDRAADASHDQGTMFKRGTPAAAGITRTDFAAAMAKAFGPAVANRLEKRGVVVPLEDQSSLPAHVVPFVRDGDVIYGFYDAVGDKTYAVLSNLTPELVKPLVLHEVGVHYGFEQMLGKDKYNQVINRLAVMGKAGNKAVIEAHENAKKYSAKPSHVPEESLAYLITYHPEMGLVREVVAKIKAFLFDKFGIGGKYLTADDMVALAKAAVLHSSRSEPGMRTPDFVNFARDEGAISDGSPAQATSASPRSAGQQASQAQAAEAQSSQGSSSAPNGDIVSTPAFRKWFSDSKVVDSDGKPLVVYHGTTQDFASFSDEKRSGKTGNPNAQLGFFFSNMRGEANRYAENWGKQGGNVMPVYLSIQNPYAMSYKEFDDLAMAAYRSLDPNSIVKFGDMEGQRAAAARLAEGERLAREAALKRRDELVAEGYDGVVVKIGGGKEYIAFNPEQIKSAIGNNGNFDATNPDIRFARSTITGQTLPNVWQSPDESKLDDFIYKLQDKHVDTKRAVQAVRDAIGQIADAQDPYLQEELYHGRAAMATKEFLEKEIRPLLTDMQARGIAIPDFEEYLHNRHAEARNIQVAKVNPKMQDGGSGIKTADAQAYLANLPANKQRAFESLAKRIEQINKGTRDLLVSSGLEKQSTIDAWQRAYGDEYVPLMREEMDNGATGIGQGYSVRGSASKRAMGSDKPVANILANIALQREKTITRAQKRRVGEAVYGLVLKAPNDDFWFAIDPDLSPSNVMATQMQLVSMGLDPADAESIAQEPKTRYVDKNTGIVQERINPALRSAENVLAVRIDGEDKFIFFNAKDPRAMRMVTALKNLDADQLGTVMGTVAKMTRYFAAVNTQWNPVFGVTNITRDVQTALLNLNSTELKDHKADVMKHILPALRGIYIDLRDHRAGKQPTSAYAAIFEEFQREGGATGYRDMYANAQERAEAIADELARIKQGKALSVGRGIMDWLSDYNESMENAVRVAAYKVGKEQGLSNQRAASLAKNLTVNFNRKGQVALQAGALYAFFNASVQGSARLAQTMFKDGGLSSTGKKILTGGILLGSMQALLLATAGFDDGEPPDFVRERSIVIPIGGSKYISIPMPLGFHIIPNLGRIPTEWAMGGFKNTPKRLAQLVGLFADAFNPIGSAGLSMQTLAPTILDPLAALTENKDWTGKPIAKKDFNSLTPTAGHTRAKDTATPWAKMISYGVNVATGGTDYKPGMASPTPDQIDYLIGQVTGGVGREVGKVAQVASSGMSGEEIPMYKIPLVGRFVGTTEGQAAEASRFYDNLRQLGEHKAEIEGLKKDRKGAQLSEYFRENKEARMVPFADKVHRDVARLEKTKRELIKNDASRERVKIIDMAITARMRLLNDRMRMLEKQD